MVFLHEELIKLPSFPRKALDADLDLYQGGSMGKVIFGHHKISTNVFLDFVFNKLLFINYK